MKHRSAWPKYLKSGCSPVRFHDILKVIRERARQGVREKRRGHRSRNAEEWLLAGRVRTATASLVMR